VEKDVVNIIQDGGFFLTRLDRNTGTWTYDLDAENSSDRLVALLDGDGHCDYHDSQTDRRVLLSVP
jgi:hypothetical protein